MSVWSRRVRRAKVSTPLLVTLGILILIAGGFWAFKLNSSDDVKIAKNPNAPKSQFEIACGKCGFKKTVDYTALAALERREGMYYCDKCKAFTAGRNRVGNASVPVAGGP